MPHDLKITWIYAMPERLVGNGLVDRVIGGWTLSGMHRYRSGGPISIGTGGYQGTALFNPGYRPDMILPIEQVKLPGAGEPKTVDMANGVPYLNPAAFARLPVTSKNVPLHLGDTPRFLDGVRGFKIMSEDFSLKKIVGLGFRESSNVEIRVDVMNLFNRVRPANPRTNINDLAQFGRVYGKTGGPRTIQAGLRISF